MVTVSYYCESGLERLLFSCIFYLWCRIFALYRLSYFKSPYIEIGLERLLF